MRILLAAAGALLLPLIGFAQAPSPAPTPDYTTFIRTPPPPAAPRINGPRIYGERPGHPFFYHLPITGRRPIAVSARGLPGGLTLDSATGNITGSVSQPGDHKVSFTVSNAAGKDTASLDIVIGQTICLTPPMGWNSWNCFNVNIDESKIRAAADAMATSGLIDHGWTYINLDDRWEGQRDAAGNIHSSAKIPDVKALASYIHGKGLKLGLYSSPGPTTCAGAVGSWQHEDQDAATYSAWGIDYLKYDWCSYSKVQEIIREQKYAEILPPAKAAQLKVLAEESTALSTRKVHPDLAYVPRTQALAQTEGSSAQATLNQVNAQLEALHHEALQLAPDKVAAIDLAVFQEPYRKMRASLDKVDRDIVFSFCQYGMGKVWEWGAATGGNLWRTTGDIGPTWPSVESHGFGQDGLEPWAGPGHWNDPDMLEIGNGHLTPDECYTHMTLWCMLSAPLLIGCDMTKMTPFVVSLFSNDEVLAVNQDPLGKQGWRAKQDGQTEVWVKPLWSKSGDISAVEPLGNRFAVAFFNRGNSPADVSVNWSDLKLGRPHKVRDLWRQKDTGIHLVGYSANVAPHGAELFVVTPLP